jgi:hypothetical protein
MTANDSVSNGHRHHHHVEPETNGVVHVNGLQKGAPPPKAVVGSHPAPVEKEREPIAIIGCGIRLPGGVCDAESFWEFLINKRDGRCIVPADRYNVSGYHTGQQPAKPGCVATEHG